MEYSYGHVGLKEDSRKEYSEPVILCEGGEVARLARLATEFDMIHVTSIVEIGEDRMRCHAWLGTDDAASGKAFTLCGDLYDAETASPRGGSLRFDGATLIELSSPGTTRVEKVEGYKRKVEADSGEGIS